jgi:hypothetical protein
MSVITIFKIENELKYLENNIEKLKLVQDSTIFK